MTLDTKPIKILFPFIIWFFCGLVVYKVVNITYFINNNYLQNKFIMLYLLPKYNIY